MQLGVCEQHEITCGDFLRVWILPDAETLILHTLYNQMLIVNILIKIVLSNILYSTRLCI